MSFSKVGRKERGSGRVDKVVAPAASRGAEQGVKPRPAWLNRHGTSLALATYETARLRHSGYDVYAVEAEWRRWANGKTPANDPDRAFLAFFRKFTEAHPL